MKHGDIATRMWVAVILAAAVSVRAGDVRKANNADDLDQVSSWVGPSVPGSGDVAVWDSTVTGLNAPALGSAQDWSGIRIADPGGDVTISGSQSLTLGAAGVDLSAALQDLHIPNAALALGATQNWSVADGKTLEVGGTIQGADAAPLTKTGTGGLTLSGNNTYDGVTTVDGGNILVTHNNALGSVAGGTVVNRSGGTGPNYTDATGQVRLDGSGGNLTIAEPIAIDGHSQYTWSGGLQSIAGDNVCNGTISLGDSGNRIKCSGGTLTINGVVTRTGGGTMLVCNPTGGRTLTFNNTIDTAGGGLLCHGGGTVVFNAVVVCGYVDVQYSTTAKLGLDDALPTDKQLKLGNIQGGLGTLDLNGHNQTIARLQQDGTAASKLNHVLTNSDGGTVGVLTLNNTDVFSYVGKITGNMGLTKSNTGTLTLSTNSTLTYTGPLSVNGGTLTLDGTTASADVTVDGGMLNGNGTLHFRIDGATADGIDLNGGTLDITQLALDFDVGGGGAAGTYVLVDYSGGGTFTNNGAPDYFASIVDLPDGFAIEDNAGSGQLQLVSKSYTWDGGNGSSQAWSTNQNWVPDGVKPVSESNTLVIIDGTNNTGTGAAPLDQDIASPLTLNKLWFRNPTGAADPVVEAVMGGGALHFVPTEGGAGPVIQGNHKGNKQIRNDIIIDAPALTIRNQTWNIDLAGKVSGTGKIVYDGSFGAGGLQLNNAGNDYSGGTEWTAGTGEWDRLSIQASGSLGTGPLVLSGGSVQPYANPGHRNPANVLFSGVDRVHTNSIVLTNNATIAVGNPDSAGASNNSVDLGGSVDLGDYTLTVRGRGTGTLSGEISGSGGISKIDDYGAGQVNTWILAGANSYTGVTAVKGGTLLVSGSLATCKVHVDGGTFGGDGTLHYVIDGASGTPLDVDSGTLDITQLALEIGVGAGGIADTYVVVDYAGGGTLTHNGAPYYFALVDTPIDGRLDEDTVNQQILFVPDKGTLLIIR